MTICANASHHALEARGFRVTSAGSVAAGLAAVESSAPVFAVADLRLADGCGLRVIEALKGRRPDARAIIQTGYGNIATAVSAAKIGAVDYLTKPTDADEIVTVLLTPEGCKPRPPEHPMTADRVHWEHIQNINCVDATYRRQLGGSRYTAVPYSAFSLKECPDKCIRKT